MWSVACSGGDCAVSLRHVFGVAIALAIGLLAAGGYAVLMHWYPQPFWQASGVLRMAAYALLAHVILTLLFLMPWRRRERRSVQSIRNDVALLALLLVLSWFLSLSFLAQGRPVALVYSVDRVTLVRANELRMTEFALPGVLPIAEIRWSGPVPLLAARPSNDLERLNAIGLALAGYDLHQRPSRWEAPERQRVQIEERVRRLTDSPANDVPSVGQRWMGHLPLDGGSGEWQLLLSETLDEYRLEALKGR
jgi:hypothetical protein